MSDANFNFDADDTVYCCALTLAEAVDQLQTAFNVVKNSPSSTEARYEC